MKIQDYHFHIYYLEPDIQLAKSIVKNVISKYDVEVGRFHEKPVGPHPMCSVQLVVSNENFSNILQWFILNREKLTVFIHPNTGNAFLDHTDHVLWLGESVKLNLEIFNS